LRARNVNALSKVLDIPISKQTAFAGCLMRPLARPSGLEIFPIDEQSPNLKRHLFIRRTGSYRMENFTVHSPD